MSTPEFGMAAHTSRSGPALELASSAALDGAGVIGDSIGTTVMRPLTMADTTPGATHSITAAALPEAPVAALATAPVHRPGLSTEIPGLLEDTLNPAARAVSARAHSATTGMGNRRGVSRHAAGPALAPERAVVVAVDVAAEEADMAAGAVGTGNRSVINS